MSKEKINMEQLQPTIIEKGELIFKLMDGHSEGSIFNKDWWYGRIMDWSMENEQFKTQMFRFVDVLPYLNSSSEVTKHLKEYFAEGGDELPSIFNFSVGVGALAPSLMAKAVRKNVTQMAKMFITGESPKEALPVLRKARKKPIAFTVDLLGEATLSEKEAHEYQTRYLELIRWLTKDAEKWEAHPIIDSDDRGAIPKVNISVKITSLYSQIRETAWESTQLILKERLRPIFTLAKEKFVFINIDMEQYAHKNLTLEVFKELLLEPEYKDYPHWGIVIQAYLRDSHQDIVDLLEFAKTNNLTFTVRLVKGAYWDYETIHADQLGWPIPVYTNKKESDANYERCCQTIFENHPTIRVAIGSHNVRSIAACLVMAEKMNVPHNAFEVQMLYGMANPIKAALIQQGYRLREYATVGELIPGMAYLVRRLLENTSNESFLRSKFADNVSTQKLLKNPKKDLEETSSLPHRTHEKFYNEALLDFAIKENRDKMLTALKQIQKSLGQTVPVVIGKKELKTHRQLERFNPSHPKQLIGNYYIASEVEAEQAVKVAKEALSTWKQTSVQERVQLIERVADLILQKRFELSALEVYEVGKTWSEADGDICEAIDFCRYYAHEMRRLGSGFKVGHVDGETNHYHYLPRGVSLVISPWNFPLAILTGMVAASVVTGNTVIMKPAEQSSLVAYELMKIFKEAGLPSGVVNFLPGLGEEVGEYLVQHKNINMIAFTGSKEVGLNIVCKTAELKPGQKHIKHSIIEMGGKNAIIIDSDADLDEAVAGVIDSAFGFSGQKCSACSRVILLDAIYERFVDRLHEAVKSIKTSYSEDPEAYLGPVVDKEAFNKINAMIEAGQQDSRLLYQGEVPEEGYFIPPTLFVDVKPHHKIAQEEIFGPVLAIIKVKNIDEAIQVANGTAFALTGGLYSRSPANIEKIKSAFEVGNLYINRSCTGALVNRHPFGGYKLSGRGSKTGGPDYLLQFVEPRVITENTMRRGFAPKEDVNVTAKKF